MGSQISQALANVYPRPIDNLIRAFSHLPSVGRRTAERFVFYLLKSGKKDVAELTLALKQLMEQVRSCEVCWDFSDRSPCVRCADPKRPNDTICVVAEPQDLQAIDRTGQFQGKYHVLRGLLDAATETEVGVKIPELITRASDPKIKEVILALSPDLPGETTMLFLEQELKRVAPHLTLTRLARGLPMGSDLQYADEITLSSALQNRVKSV